MATKPRIELNIEQDLPLDYKEFTALKELKREQKQLENCPSPETLDKLADSKFGIIRLVVAAHPNTDEKTLLLKLTNDNDEFISRVARNTIGIREFASRKGIGLHSLQRK